MKTKFNDPQELHAIIFSEEFDQMEDSNSDAYERKMGRNPMSIEYQEKVNAKRELLGVSPLTTAGLPKDNSAMELCITVANDYKAGKISPIVALMKNIIEEAENDEEEFDLEFEESERIVPNIKADDPSTWSEIMIQNCFKYQQELELFLELDSMTFEAFKAKLFSDKEFAKERCPKGNMDSEDYR